MIVYSGHELTDEEKLRICRDLREKGLMATGFEVNPHIESDKAYAVDFSRFQFSLKELVDQPIHQETIDTFEKQALELERKRFFHLFGMIR